ncbi:hypothetical protein HF998_00475 [Cellulomonas hominis]|nr:hypothetical protein [Cellulomonas hominis]
MILPPVLAQGPAHAEAAPEVAEIAAAAALPESLDPPALTVLQQLLGSELTYGQVVPAPFGCATPVPVVSATAAAPEGDVGLFVLATGEGGTWRQAMSHCGRSITLPSGVVGVRMNVAGGQVVAWSRGDVLATLSGADVATAAVSAVDARLMDSLEPVCPDLSPTAQDATRNPRSPGYQQWLREETVSIEASGVQAVDLSALPTPAEAPDLVMPAGVAGPPAPSKAVRPEPLTDPGPEVLTTTVAVPAWDAVGPGCGWAFTAAAAPAVVTSDVEDAAQQARAASRATLLAGQAAWISAVADASSRVAAQAADVEAWNAYVAAAREVKAEWDAQAAAIATWKRERDARSVAVRARDAWRADRQSAQAAYDAAVTACAKQPAAAAGAITVEPAPGPGGASACPPARAPILDEPEPAVPEEPTAPVLWSP